MADGFDGLSDKALSIFTFAAYHRLLSGETVSSVIRKDGAGHEADPEGVSELEGRGLVTASETGIALGAEAQDFVETLVLALRREAGR
ncbi:hypothetical protein [uncultured Methylobacterium sp.]|uniref:hypothetical protein n=1 Tax=uncultured Methylobacterium sp. TaxID=157278 RepID=UPI0035C9E9B0